jgi:hypothetical protein
MFPSENITSPSNRASFLYGVGDKPRLVGDSLFAMKRLDVVGKVFGYVAVKSFSHVKNGHAYYHCVCTKCGETSDKIGSHLKKYALSKAGGGCRCCFRKEIHKVTTIHGMDGSPELKCWRAIKSRCTNKNSSEYFNYGGRGITMCDRWTNSFQHFYNDMGPRPSNKHSIDRIDNNGNYEPDNCRWATQTEQINNRRVTLFINYLGKKTPLKFVSNKTGIPYAILYTRITRLGWAAEKAISTPYSRRKHTNHKQPNE